jgi:hypothetical protein
MPELERLLTQLGREIDYPPTPDLAAVVTVRLGGAKPIAGEPAPPPTGVERAPGEAAPPPTGVERAPGAPSPARRHALGIRDRLLRALAPGGLRRSLVLALVALLLLAGTVFAAVPGARDAVLEFFGLQGATVERRPELPEPPELRPLDLGTRVTLAEATGELDFSPLVPSGLGRPGAVYVRNGLPGGELSLAYRSRPGLPEARTTRLGLLASEFRGDLHPDLIGKLAGERTRIEPTRVDGHPAIWIEGAPHFFFYRDPNGNVIEGELRLAQNVLLLERGNLLVRLEGAFGRERAIALARSLRRVR